MIKIEEKLTKKDVCEAYRISLSNLDRQMKNGLPYYKIGKSVRFKKEDLEEWFKRNK